MRPVLASNISDREPSLSTWFLSVTIWANHLKPQFQRRYFGLQSFNFRRSTNKKCHSERKKYIYIYIHTFFWPNRSLLIILSYLLIPPVLFAYCLLIRQVSARPTLCRRYAHPCEVWLPVRGVEDQQIQTWLQVKYDIHRNVFSLPFKSNEIWSHWQYSFF